MQHALPWTCPTAWWLAASIVAVMVMLGILWRWRQRHLQRQAQSAAAQAARDSETHAMEEAILQSGQGLILRFEAIARRLPPDHPVRRDIDEALDRAEYVLEKGLDRAQHRRDAAASPPPPGAPGDS
jgi:biopolymer transport protein ExbB/TolQ